MSRPSGEIVGVLISATLSGISIVKLIGRLSTERGRKYSTAKTAVVSNKAPATIQGNNSRRFRQGIARVTGITVVESEDVAGPERASTANARSRAELNRSSGFFSRQ